MVSWSFFLLKTYFSGISLRYFLPSWWPPFPTIPWFHFLLSVLVFLLCALNLGFWQGVELKEKEFCTPLQLTISPDVWVKISNSLLKWDSLPASRVIGRSPVNKPVYLSILEKHALFCPLKSSLAAWSNWIWMSTTFTCWLLKCASTFSAVAIVAVELSRFQQGFVIFLTTWFFPVIKLPSTACVVLIWWRGYSKGLLAS